MNNLVLNRVFSKNVILDCISQKENDCYITAVNKYSPKTKSCTNKAAVHSVYRYIEKLYRNEYYYKNTLLNKLILEKHDIKSTVALTELPIANSIADFVMLNGKIVVYEIKTELDKLSRLATQINDYYKFSPNVCIVTCEEHYEKVCALLDNKKTGIYVIRQDGSIDVRREPIEDMSQLDIEVIFKVLRKKEFEQILMSAYKQLPSTRQFDYYKTSLKWMKKLDIDYIYKETLSLLKKRPKIIEGDFKSVPYELKFFAYTAQLNSLQYVQLANFLSNNVGG